MNGDSSFVLCLQICVMRSNSATLAHFFGRICEDEVKNLSDVSGGRDFSSCTVGKLLYRVLGLHLYDSTKKAGRIRPLD
jgi:hypothetical protein